MLLWFAYFVLGPLMTVLSALPSGVTPWWCLVSYVVGARDQTQIDYSASRVPSTLHSLSSSWLCCEQTNLKSPAWHALHILYHSATFMVFWLFLRFPFMVWFFLATFGSAQGSLLVGLGDRIECWGSNLCKVNPILAVLYSSTLFLEFLPCCYFSPNALVTS